MLVPLKACFYVHKHGRTDTGDNTNSLSSPPTDVPWDRGRSDGMVRSTLGSTASAYQSIFSFTASLHGFEWHILQIEKWNSFCMYKPTRPLQEIYIGCDPQYAFLTFQHSFVLMALLYYSTEMNVYWPHFSLHSVTFRAFAGNIDLTGTLLTHSPL